MILGQRFWGKVNKAPSGCWLWTSAIDDNGYPVFWVDEKHRAARAYRLSYEALVGPIPDGLTLDHLCRVKLCVNPRHLDPCTKGENAKRSPDAPYHVKARYTHCEKGHEFTAANTIIHHGRRECRICTNRRQRDRRIQGFRKSKPKVSTEGDPS
jgi:hypothetical protein